MPPPAAQSKTSLLTKKKGPLPVWAWLALSAVAGWYLWKKLGSSVGTTNPAAATPQDTSAAGGLPATDNSGATGAGGVASGGLSASDLASALGASNQSLADMLAQELAASNADLISQLQQQPPGGTIGPGFPGEPPVVTPPTGTQPGGANAPIYHRVAAATPNFGAKALAQTNTLAAAGKAAPFGGVTSVKRLANGSTVTTYASGRKVQQAPGKSAYVIHH